MSIFVSSPRPSILKIILDRLCSMLSLFSWGTIGIIVGGICLIIGSYYISPDEPNSPNNRTRRVIMWVMFCGGICLVCYGVGHQIIERIPIDPKIPQTGFTNLSSYAEFSQQWFTLRGQNELESLTHFFSLNPDRLSSVERQSYYGLMPDVLTMLDQMGHANFNQWARSDGHSQRMVSVIMSYKDAPQSDTYHTICDRVVNRALNLMFYES